MQKDHANYYSTSEYDTGKKWVDGKTPIYRKTFSVSQLPNNTTETFPHGLTAGTASGNMDLSKFAKVTELSAQDPDAGPPALSINENHANITGLSIVGNNVHITTNGNLSAYNQVYVTIEYCKVA